MSIVNSYNLFVDTERNLSQDSTGDNIYLPLGQTPITCGSNEFIRLTLQEFSMYKSWNNVNSTNNVFRVADANSEQTSAITVGNYATPRTMLNRGFIGNSLSGFLPVAPLKTALENLVNFGGGSTTITSLVLNTPTSGDTCSNCPLSWVPNSDASECIPREIRHNVEILGDYFLLIMAVGMIFNFLMFYIK